MIRLVCNPSTRVQRRLAAAGTLAVCTSVCASFEAKDTKILDLSWTTPSAPALAGQLSTHQYLPVDGVITDLIQNSPAIGAGNPADLFAWRTWGPAMNTASFSQATSSLNPASLGRFKDSLLRFNVAGPQTDWFDSAGLLANAQAASSVMAQGGFKGILLDTEYYPNVAPGTAFDYTVQPQKGSHTFAQYQTQARLVGAQFMQALRTQNPDAQVMLTFGYKSAGTNQSLWSTQPYGLLPAFLDGMLDQAGPNNLLIDGFEDAYGYNSSAQYDAAYQTIKVDNAALTANPTGFADHMRASFSFWLDRGPNGQSTVWDPNNIANNQYSPAQFQFAVQEAAKRSDKYVWIYAQIASWWNGNIPLAYVDALKNVRKVGSFERFRGTIKDTATWAAHTELSGAITQNNSLSIDAVNFSTASQADYTTKSLTVSVGGLVSVEVKNTTTTTNTGLWASAKVGIALTNDSGGTSGNVLADNRALSLVWSNAADAILAGVSDANGVNQYTTIASGDHPTNTNYIYQIERLSATTAKFTLINPNGGAIIGTPQVRTISGVPGDLFVSLFAQGGDATFNNVWVAAAVYSGWVRNGSGDWNTLANWSTTSLPGATDTKVLFGGAIDSARTVYADSAITVGAMKFDNANSYQIAGQGSLTLDVSSGSVTIDVLQGNHKINLPLFVNDNTTANIQAGASLRISNPLTLVAGSTLTKSGAGTLSIEAPVYNVAGSAIVAQAGALSVSTDVGPKTSLSITGGQMVLGSNQHLDSLSLTSGSLDLQGRRIIAMSPGTDGFNQLRTAVIEGRLFSSVSASSLSLALGLASDLSPGGTNMFGESVSPNAIALGLTVAGDANLDFVVDSSDFNQLLSHYGDVSDARWTQGDFDYDGKVTSTDFNLFAGHFGGSAAISLGSVVPEPALLFPLVVATAGLLRRRA